MSGACAILIAFQADAASVSIADVTGISAADDLRWLTGKVGFTAAGLALVVAAWYQWRVGGMLRRVAPASVVLGIAMQVIWVPSATIIHPIVGSLFLLWLLAIGTMLATSRVERHFVARYGEETGSVASEPASGG